MAKNNGKDGENSIASDKKLSDEKEQKEPEASRPPLHSEFSSLTDD